MKIASIILLPLDGGGLRWPPAQRASGSERGGPGMVPLTPALSHQGRGG